MLLSLTRGPERASERAPSRPKGRVGGPPPSPGPRARAADRSHAPGARALALLWPGRRASRAWSHGFESSAVPDLKTKRTTSHQRWLDAPSVTCGREGGARRTTEGARDGPLTTRLGAVRRTVLPIEGSVLALLERRRLGVAESGREAGDPASLARTPSGGRHRIRFSQVRGERTERERNETEIDQLQEWEGRFKADHQAAMERSCWPGHTSGLLR